MMERRAYEDIADLLRDQRVLLIGGAGFIGHHLALSLKQAGCEVAVVDNLMLNSLVDNVYKQDLDVIRRELYRTFLLERFSLLRDAGVALHNADARLLGDLTTVFQDFSPTKVVHLSAIASAVEAKRLPGLTFDIQLITLRNVLELSRLDEDVNQVLLMSSSTVYGDFITPEVDETFHPQPRGIYANTKYMAERLLRTYRDQYELGVTIVRPSALYGPRCISRRVSQIFVENALNGVPLILEGGGRGTLDFTHVSDLVQGLVRALALHRDRDDSNTFNLTFGEARPIAELASILSEVIPNAEVVERPLSEDKPVRGTLSVKRAREILGYEPKFPLEKGYREFCQMYVEDWAAAKARA